MNPYQQGQPGAPYQSYPQYGQPQPYLHNIGFSGAPQSFGMPYPGMQHPSPYPSPYPQGQAGYPSHPQNHPPGSYPSQQSGYPPQQSGYPPQQSGYPSQQSGYPTQHSAYPTQQYAPQGETAHEQHYASHQFSSQPQAVYGQPAQTAQQTIKPKPTVVPVEPFNPRADAEVLRKAMKGFGTDEKAIIRILANRSNEQRLRIAFEFKTLYGKDLIDDLKSECTGHFEEVVVALMTPLPQLYAQEMRKAVNQVGTDEDTLIEVLCTMTNHEIQVIQNAYQSMYRTSMTNDMASDTSGSFRRFLISLSCANRDEGYHVDTERARNDAQALLRAGELRMGTDESTFNAVLCQRSFAQLAATFKEYESVTGHPFEKAVKNEFSGDIKDGLLAIVKCVKSRAEFFAERLHKSMAGLGTTDHQLIRIIVTRSEVDMGDIKEAFEAKYGKSLQSWIEGDTSGYYKKCLLALIGCYKAE